jgi:hypothetical protein
VLRNEALIRERADALVWRLIEAGKESASNTADAHTLNALFSLEVIMKFAFNRAVQAQLPDEDIVTMLKAMESSSVAMITRAAVSLASSGLLHSVA